MGEPLLRIINAPFDLCGRSPGSRLGPAAAKLAGLRDQALGAGVLLDEEEGGWEMDSVADFRSGPPPDECLRRCIQLKGEVAAALEKGRMPLVIGGDHSLSMGSVSGALEAFGSDLGVLWVDAHMDLNTPDVSASGNIHGMPLAALMRLPERQPSVLSGFWDAILGEVVPNPGLAPQKTAWIGLRDVDEGEARRHEELGRPFAATMEDIDALGMAACMARFRAWIEESGICRLWISFDVDSLDPFYAPGTGTAVRGGLTYREGHFLGEALHRILFVERMALLAGLDIVEINPLLDHENTTARMAAGWLATLLGRRILPRPSRGLERAAD